MPKQAELAEQRNGTYNAIIATYKAMHRSIAAMLSEEGLTQPQFYALRAIAKCGPTLMKRISGDMQVTPANITGIIDRLESKGLIRRTGRKGDRRTTIIELTSKGKEMHERVASRYGEFMQKVLQTFTVEEQNALRSLLEKLQEEMSRSAG